MLYVRFPLTLRNAEDLLHERGSEVTGETGEQTRAAAHAAWRGLLTA
jgi:transposase-like protein